jgi:Domain of unknown function (DUF4124)
MVKKVLILVLLLLTVASVSAKIFKWVDENGVTHYSETPPPKQKAQEIQVQPESATEGNDGANTSAKRLHEEELEYEQYKAKREAAQKKQELEDAAAQHNAVVKKEKCVLARQNLFILQQQKPVFTINGNGDRVYLNDQQRASEIERIKKNIEIYCEHQ